MKKIKEKKEAWQCKCCGRIKSYRIGEEGLSIVCDDFACDDETHVLGDFTDIMELIEQRIKKDGE